MILANNMRPRNKFFHSTHFPHICPSLEDDKWIVCFADTRMRKRESVCFSFILPHPKTLNQALYVAKFLTCYPYIYRNGSLVCWGRCLGEGGSVPFHLGLGSWKLGQIVMSMLCIAYQYDPIVCNLSMNTRWVTMSFFF